MFSGQRISENSVNPTHKCWQNNDQRIGKKNPQKSLRCHSCRMLKIMVAQDYGCSKLWLKEKSILKAYHSNRSTRSHASGLFQPNSLIPRIDDVRRVGKPTTHWLIETYTDAYRESGQKDHFDINNILQIDLPNELAQQRRTKTQHISWHSVAYFTSPKISSPKTSSLNISASKAGIFPARPHLR